jgi:hypothetical protein
MATWYGSFPEQLIGFPQVICVRLIADKQTGEFQLSHPEQDAVVP